MNEVFKAVFSQYAGIAFAKQLALSDFLGEHRWDVDLQEGIVDFGDNRVYPLQVIGTESNGDGSWLWAWANHQSGFSESLLKASLEVKQYGHTHQISELITDSFPAEPVNGHFLSMIASGLNPNSCYYAGTHPGGGFYFLVNNMPTDVIGPFAPERVLTVLAQGIEQFDMDHRVFAESFLKTQGYSTQTTNTDLEANRDQESLTISFDTNQRIANLKGSIKPAVAKPEKKAWQFWRR